MDNLLKHLHILEVNPTGLLLKSETVLLDVMYLISKMNIVWLKALQFLIQ